MKDNRKNLISIVVPFYNAEEKIELLIESILNQDLANVEFVFVNDGSIDNTEGKVKEKLENCAIDFKFINKANGGVSSARNLGLNSVIGQYVMFVDSDDALLPNVIQMIKKEIRVNNEPDVLMFEYLRYKNDEKEKCLTYIVDDNQSQERENKYTDPSLLLERYLSGEL
ncbi:TPA: glycosyltransferase family A protein, partial [Vibrio metschnikovii]